jgi:hypothetical protein
MHGIEVEMMFFECLHMVLYIKISNKDGQFLNKNLVMLGFHWKVMVYIHLVSLGLDVA